MIFFKACIFWKPNRVRPVSMEMHVRSGPQVWLWLWRISIIFVFSLSLLFVLQVSVRVHKRKNAAKTKNSQGEAEWLLKRRRLVTSAASCNNGVGRSMAAAHQESSRLWTSKQTKEMDLQKERRNANRHYLSHIISNSFNKWCEVELNVRK